MTPDETRAHIERCVDAISVPLYEGVTTGYAYASARLASLPNIEDYPSITPMLARYPMRNYWLDNGLGSGWAVRGNPRLSGQIILVNNEQNLTLRVLKERRTRYPGGVPLAGSNDARRAAWTAPMLNIVIPGQAIAEPHRLLVLWDRLIENGEERVTVRVVHTIAPGVYGRAVPIDLSYEVKPNGGIFDQLSFGGDAQPDDFFPDISQDENGEGTSGR